MKLELKHLAPYLPYEIYGIWKDPYAELETEESKGVKTQIKGHYFFNDKPQVVTYDNGGFGLSNYNEIMPILRPLSDLTKEIKHKGEKFVPMDFLKGLLGNLTHLTEDKRIFPNGYNLEDGFEYETEDYSQVLEVKSFWDVKDMLLEWHFDVFGLIEKGLAIDINTLKYE